MSIVKWKGHSDNNLPVAKMVPAVFSDFFDSFFGNELLLGNDSLSWVPAVNVYETDSEFNIELAAPGLGKDDFRVEVDNNVLSISGERKEHKKDEQTHYSRREFSYGSFKRSFNLPQIVDTEAIMANYENGVLKLVVPKKEEAKRKPVKEITIC
jgi:HSP20 family protein